MQTKVFTPLGMTTTTFDFAKATKGDHASPHGVDIDGKLAVSQMGLNYSIAPVRPEHRELLVRTLQHVEDMSPHTLFAGVPWDEFETFPQYLDSIEARGTLINYACYVGHTAVRIFVMGEAGYERAATDDEIGRMQHVIAEAMA